MPQERTFIADGKTYKINAHAWQRIRKLDIEISDVGTKDRSSNGQLPTRGANLVNISYDPDGDMLFIELNENEEFTTDSESIPGLAIMYDENGKVCAIEIEDASQLVTAPNRVNFVFHTQGKEESAPQEDAMKQPDAQP